MSSLEHEVWQELSGYDAVSTVRGIQMAMAQNAGLATLNKTTLLNNTAAAAQWAKFGFAMSPPMLGYTYDTSGQWFGYLTFQYYSPQRLIRMYYSTSPYDEGMQVLRRMVTTSTSSLRKTSVTLAWDPVTPGNNYAFYIDCYATNLRDLYFNTASATVTNWNSNRSFQYAHSCWGVDPTGGPYYDYKEPATGTVWNYYAQNWNNFYTNNANFLNFFDEQQGYLESDHAYRNIRTMNALDLPLETVAAFRDNILLTTENREYVTPGSYVNTGFNRFTVYLFKRYDTGGSLVSQQYGISNAGGGYVDGSVKLVPATTVQGASTVLPAFNNDQFTDKMVVSQTNNDQVKTPSTIDPVSTVTGNNYHDETDLAIKGRGLDTIFTRTYNSASISSKTDGDFGFGWTHSYGMKLKSNDFGSCPNCTTGTNTAIGQRPENDNSYTSSFPMSTNAAASITTLLMKPPSRSPRRKASTTRSLLMRQ